MLPKKIFKALCAAVFFALLPTVALANGAPNVVLLMADDLGWADPQCFNADSPIETPHLDRMAAAGLRFTRFYAAAPVCSPTRGSCLTGRHPLRYGIKTANNGHLRAEEQTLPELMKAAGYATGHFGKWHLGTLSRDYSGKGAGRRPDLNFCTPGSSGFDEWFSTEFAVATWDPYAKENSHLRGGRFDTRALFWKNGRNITEPLTGCTSKTTMDHALPFIESAVEGNRPFLAVIWFHAPHAPVVGGPDYLRAYPGANENQQHYYAVVDALDDQVGRLLDRLAELKVGDNTMVWFCSDNGPEGNPGPQGRSQGSAAPFRGRKRSLYEGGVRVPGILHWPARVRAGRVSDVPCVTSDYLPTILAAADISLDPQLAHRLDGVDLMPLVNGDDSFDRQKPIGFEFGKQSTWVERRFKLVHNRSQRRLRSDNGSVPLEEYELYDLLQDPSETSNLADKHPETVRRMRSELTTWRDSLTKSAVAANRQ